MKASELRIGNLVEHVAEFSGCHFSITGISEKTCSMRGISGPAKEFSAELTETTILPNGRFDGLRPIPLSEEWLLRFGFEKRFSSELPLYSIAIKVGIASDSLNVRLFKNSVAISLGYADTLKVIWDKHPQHVHQLQNLYFALSGQELTIKELAHG